MPKLLTLTCILLAVINAANAQNQPGKEDTIKWIVKELQNNVTNNEKVETVSWSNFPEQTEYFDYKIYQVENTSTIKVSYSKRFKSHKANGTPFTENSINNITFNINDIISFAFTREVGGGTQAKNIILRLNTASDKVAYTTSSPDGKSSNSIGKVIDISIDLTSEPNLQERLTKALQALIDSNKPPGDDTY
jgi:hypothetical protein